jgi:uncharacterized Zn-finger protein
MVVEAKDQLVPLHHPQVYLEMQQYTMAAAVAAVAQVLPVTL